VVAEIEPDEDGSDGDELAEGFVALLDDLASEDDWLLWVETDRLLPPWATDRTIFDAIDLGPLLEEDAPTSEEDNPEAMPAVAQERPALEPLGDPPDEMPIGDGIFRERLHGTYAAAICEFDTLIGFLLAQLREKLPDDSASFSLISLSGLSLGEHGSIGPGRASLHEERVHLAWIVRLPKHRLAGQRFACPTQPADILPTLFRGHRGASAREMIGAERPYAVSWTSTDAGATIGLRLPDWYAILTPDARGAKLFLKPDDRWEVNEVGQQHAEWVEELQTFARAWRTGEPLPNLGEPGNADSP